MASYKFTYFDVIGRGELSRLLMVLGKMNWSEVRLNFVEWPEWKMAENCISPWFRSLPVLDVTYEDGSTLKITQSMAMSRYLARKANLIGKTEQDQLDCECFIEHLDDLLRSGGALPFIHDAELRQKKVDDFYKNTAPSMFGVVEKKLATTKTGHIVGDSLTAADVFLTVVVDHHVRNFEKPLLDDFPLCKELYEKVKSNPLVAEWQKENPGRGPFPLMKEVAEMGKMDDMKKLISHRT